MVSRSDVEDALTWGGTRPLACAFLACGVIYGWGPVSRLRAFRMEDNELYQACASYLAARGKDFRSVPLAIAAAVREKWPHWDRLPARSSTAG